MRIVLPVLIGLLLVGSLPAAESDAAPLHQPNAVEEITSQLWLVSTRHLPSYCNQTQNADGPQYWKYAAGEWLESTRAEFDEADERSVPICILVPGAPATFDRVVSGSTSVFFDVAPLFPADTPVRFVIWAWPTDPAYRAKLRSYRELGERCMAQSYYLASFVDSIDRRVPVCLAGFSYGTRMSAAALQLLAGGRVANAPPLLRRTDEPQSINAIFVAGAIDSNWLLPCARYGLALSQVDRALVTINSCDTTLQKYPKLYGILRHRPNAIGLVGTRNPSQLDGYLDRYEEIDITQTVGATHDPLIYLNAPELQVRLKALVLANSHDESQPITARGYR